MAIMCDGNPFEFFDIQEIANNETKKEVKLIWNPKMTRHGLMMDELRRWYKKSMKVNSWYREKEYNESIGGDENSCHLDGIATDIALGGLSQHQINIFMAVWQSICIRYGVIGGISIYRWGLHFDSNNDPNRYGKFRETFRITDFR